MIKSWEEVKVEQFIEISEELKRLEEDEVNTIINLCAILLNKSEKEVADMEFSKFKKIESAMSFIHQPIKHSNNKIVIENEEFKLMPFTTIEFGSYIDIEELIKKDGAIFHMGKILSVLYRRSNKKKGPFSEIEYEKYSNWLESRQHYFNNLSIVDVYKTFMDYMAFRQKILNNYPGLFSVMEKEEGELDLTGLSSKEIDAIKQDERVAKWGWETMLMKLVNNNPSKLNDAASMPLIRALNLSSYLHELKIG